MTRSDAGKVSYRNVLRVTAGLVLLAILIVVVDTRAVVDHLANLRIEFLLYAAVCVTLSTLLGSYNAYLVVAADSDVSYPRFLACYWFSWALGLVVPGQVGDVASLTYLLKRAGLNWSNVMARALLDKVISLLVIGLLAAIALLRFSELLTIQTGTVIGIAGATLIGAAAAYYFARRILNAAPGEGKWRATIRASLQDLGAFVRAHPGRVGFNVVGTVVKILLSATAYWYVFIANGADNPPWLDVMLLVTVSSLVAYLPISFNGLGTVEITGILLFSLLGLAEALVLSSYLVLRATVMAIAWVPSLPMLFLSGKRAG